MIYTLLISFAASRELGGFEENGFRPGEGGWGKYDGQRRPSERGKI